MYVRILLWYGRLYLFPVQVVRSPAVETLDSEASMFACAVVGRVKTEPLLEMVGASLCFWWFSNGSCSFLFS